MGGNNFLTQLVSEATREGALLELFACEQRRTWEGCGGWKTTLGHSNHKLTEFLILGEVRSRVSSIASLYFWRVEFGLLRRLFGRVPREAVQKGKGVQEGWTHFKNKILKAQEKVIPMC